MPADPVIVAIYKDLERGEADLGLLGTELGPTSETKLQLEDPKNMARYADIIRPNIYAALREDEKKEWILYGMLVVLFAAAIILAILAVSGWKATGALPGVTAIWPIGKLMRLRQRNLQLRLLPELMPLLGRQDMTRIIKQFFLERN